MQTTIYYGFFLYSELIEFLRSNTETIHYNKLMSPGAFLHYISKQDYKDHGICLRVENNCLVGFCYYDFYKKYYDSAETDRKVIFIHYQDVMSCWND